MNRKFELLEIVVVLEYWMHEFYGTPITAKQISERMKANRELANTRSERSGDEQPYDLDEIKAPDPLTVRLGIRALRSNGYHNKIQSTYKGYYLVDAEQSRNTPQSEIDARVVSLWRDGSAITAIAKAKDATGGPGYSHALQQLYPGRSAINLLQRRVRREICISQAAIAEELEQQEKEYVARVSAIEGRNPRNEDD